MVRMIPWALALAACRLVAAEFGLAGQLFQLYGSSSVNSAKLNWATVTGASSYQVQRSTSGGAFTAVVTVPGNTYDSYDLAVGTSYQFRVTALNGASTVDQSSVTTLVPYSPQGTYSTFGNAPEDGVSSARRTDVSTTEHYKRATLYRYNYETFSNGSFSHFAEQTSTDGSTWTGNRVVLRNVDMCASVNYSCKLERIAWKVHPTTGQYVMWAHFERAADYSLGWVCNVYTNPGAASLTFNGAYRPLDHDSRDLTFYNDGNSAYLVSSTNTNSDMNIYSLTSNWTAVDKLVTTVNVKQYREAPAVIKSDGWYYLFTSRASGWLPSQPQYITARSMAGPWSSPVNVANTATFASQSGGIQSLSNGQFMMYSDRWSANWPTPGGATRQLNLPLSLSSSQGFATYCFYPLVKYSTSVTSDGQAVYGVQKGRILSDNKSSTSNAGSTNITFANNGVQNDPTQQWIPSQVPFWYQIDLGSSYTITRVDLTTKMVQGSETFYQYNITGSTDNSSFTLLADKTSNKDPGFSASFPTSTQKFRYIRINVQSVINNVNGNSASWAVGVNEVTVYGN